MASARAGARRAELIGYLDEFLAAGELEDHCPNGLQVEGREHVRKVVTGVSACLELFERAAEVGADLVLVHHGIFWSGDSPVLTGVQRARVAALIGRDLNLAAYHLPLDRHAELGNNALAARRLGLVDVRPFGRYKGQAIGCSGSLPEPLSLAELGDLAAGVFGQRPLLVAGGDKPVGTLGIISGAAERMFYEAIDEGLDAFLTGEVSEWVMNLARESGTHFLAAGHYATERLGIRALGEHLAERFDLDVEFIDVPNSV